MENPNFLKNKYNLHNAPEVEAAAKRTERRTSQELPLKSAEDANLRIQNYLDRFKEIVERENPEERERGIEALKKILHKKFIIKPENIPENYFNSLKQKHRDEGHGDIEIPEEYRRDLIKVIIGDQEKSLDRWIDYLGSDQDKHDYWLKYFAFRSILKIGRYDKKKKSFTERYGNVIAPFPDLNREALAIILGDIEKKENNESELEFTKRYDIEPEIIKKYRQALVRKNFSVLYALAMEEFKPIPEELLKITEGKWIKYAKGSDHMPLVNSISEYGTGWCLRGEDMAQRYLERDRNDLYVYYSNDKDGKSVVPRVVMVISSKGHILEVRGVAEGENLDPYIGGVVEAKLNESEFEEEGRVYKKKSADMKFLTMIDSKVKSKKNLNKQELIFLYEIESPIEGFGYNNESDPRIKEICNQRKNPKDDMPVIFECSSDQIAENVNEINENTRAYIGTWNIEIFQKIKNYPNIRHLYESFPDKKIFMQTLKTNSEINYCKLADEALTKKGMYFFENRTDILYQTGFNDEAQEYKLVGLTVEQLGFPNGGTTDEIYKKAEDSGLRLCPAEVGPHLCLQCPGKGLMFIAMRQISDRYGHERIFFLKASGRQFRLLAETATPVQSWEANDKFVFLFEA